MNTLTPKKVELQIASILTDDQEFTQLLFKKHLPVQHIQVELDWHNNNGILRFHLLKKNGYIFTECLQYSTFINNYEGYKANLKPHQVTYIENIKFQYQA